MRTSAVILLGLANLFIASWGIYKEHRLNEEILRKERLLRKQILGCKTLNYIYTDDKEEKDFGSLVNRMARGQKLTGFHKQIAEIIGEDWEYKLNQSNSFLNEIIALESLALLCSRGCFEGLGGDGIAIKVENNKEGTNIIRIKHIDEVITRGLFKIDGTIRFRNIGVNGLPLSECVVKSDSIVLTDALDHRIAYPIEKGKWKYYH